MRIMVAALLLSGCALAQRPEFVRIPGKPYSMGKTEVTVREFTAFVAATGYKTAAERTDAARTWQKPGFKLEDNQPVVYVTPLDASAYCRWAGGSLPTDAEWVHAARAGSSTRHYWGDAIDDRHLWYRANSDGHPHAVGKKLPNAWGLYDIEGNVWEWTAADPVKGELQANRRGGSWVDCDTIEAAPGKQDSPLIGIDVTFSLAVSLEHRHDDIGFRCVRRED